MILDTQMPEKYRVKIDEQLENFGKKPSVQVRNEIPDTSQIPIKDPLHWLKIPGVICVYVDMLGSTKLSAKKHEHGTARAYQLYTGTAVDIFHSFEAPYIDVRGDGVFALFDEEKPFRAIAAAVTFKTFAHEEFCPKVNEELGIEIGSHIGVDQKTVLVKKIGLMRYEDRTDRQNEVWAGKPVNMAAKLASISQNNELIVSDRYYSNIQDKLVTHSCGCGSEDGQPNLLWSEVDLAEDERFDFDLGYRLGSIWCSKHGSEYCEAILALDD